MHSAKIGPSKILKILANGPPVHGLIADDSRIFLRMK
jgi:hypothetical protein